MQRDHLAVLAAHKGVHGRAAEVRGEHSIESVRAAAALQVAEYDAARLLARQPLDLARHVVADAAEARRVLAVAGVLVNLSPADRDRALRGDDDRELAVAALALVDLVGDGLARERNLRDEYHVRPARYA